MPKKSKNPALLAYAKSADAIELPALLKTANTLDDEFWTPHNFHKTGNQWAVTVRFPGQTLVLAYVTDKAKAARFADALNHFFFKAGQRPNAPDYNFSPEQAVADSESPLLALFIVKVRSLVDEVIKSAPVAAEVPEKTLSQISEILGRLERIEENLKALRIHLVFPPIYPSPQPQSIPDSGRPYIGDPMPAKPMFTCAAPLTVPTLFSKT